MPKLSNEDIVTIVLNEESQTDSYEESSSELTGSREKALQYYYGKPRGDEIVGASQVISKDVADTIDSMLTQLMPVFSSDNIVQFEPLDEQDEEQARIESNFTNHVVMEQNDGFVLLGNLIKDALLQKNAVCKVFVDTKTKSVSESYKGLTEEELFVVMQPQSDDEEIDVTKFSEKDGNITLKRITTKRKLMVEAIAPENFAVSADLTTVALKDTTYCRELSYPTRSDLIEAGYDKKVVANLPPYTTDTDEEASERKELAGLDSDHYHVDPSMQLIELKTHYIVLDRSGDGRAELLKVVTAGRAELEVTEADFIPYASGTAFPMPHQHYGMSIYDKLKEVQDIKTHFLRQWSDNALKHNHNKTDVIEEQVEMEDFLNARADGIRRVETLDSSRDIVPHDIAPSCQVALNYWDKIRTDRTGATLGLQGNQIDMPSNVGNQGVNTLVQNLERVTSLVSKNISETLVASMYELVHTTLRTQFPSNIQARIGGKWSNTNPTEWRERSQINLTLPPTETEKIVQAQGLEAAIVMAQQDIQGGLGDVTTSLANLYQLRLDLLRLKGVNRPDKYLIDPSSPESQQAQQESSQRAQQEQAKAEQLGMEDRRFAQMLQMKAVEVQQSEVERNLREDIARLELDLQTLVEKTNYDYAKLNAENTTDNKKIDSDSEIAEAKMVADSTTRIGIESLKGLKSDDKPN